jgi:hypothetical protein
MAITSSGSAASNATMRRSTPSGTPVSRSKLKGRLRSLTPPRRRQGCTRR